MHPPGTSNLCLETSDGPCQEEMLLALLWSSKETNECAVGMDRALLFTFHLHAFATTLLLYTI